MSLDKSADAEKQRSNTHDQHKDIHNANKDCVQTNAADLKHSSVAKAYIAEKM